MIEPDLSPRGASFAASFRVVLLFAGGLGLAAAARAVVPPEARGDALFAKGYLVANYYANIHSDGTHATETTAGLNEALADAYAENLVLYLRPGIYLVNDTLKAHTRQPADGSPSHDPTVPHLAMVGSTLGAARPLIRLDAATAIGFNSASSPKSVLEFKHFDGQVEKQESGYYQMLRGIDVDCGGKPGAIGVYFNQAQDSSIEDVRVDATGAFAGFKGLPSRSCGVVNIEVEGGQYGIDTDGTQNVGSVVAGVILRNQTVSAFRHTGFAITVVGFEIVTRPNSSTPALTIAQRSSAAHTSNISLVDGIIRLSPGFTGAVAVSNPNTRSIYLRNVYVTGGTNLVKSGANVIRTGGGAWSRIHEYSYCNQGAAAQVQRETWNLIDGVASRAPAPLNTGEVVSIFSDVAPPPADLVSRHGWASLPTVDDTDYHDPVAAGDFAPGNVSSSVFQQVIDRHRKVFLRAGIYALDNTVTLRNDTVLFGAARHLTRIEVQSGWAPTSEVPVITTDPDAAATTYLGDLIIGVPGAGSFARDFFTALDWQAGANSMVHVARPYRNPDKSPSTTNPHSLLRIRNAGGGRWYFIGRGQTFGMRHKDYRILKVEGTTQPLWFYGLNVEHAQGDSFVEFAGARNVRIYSVKTEFSPLSTQTDTTLFSFRDVQNAALFGHAAIRGASDEPFNNHEFLGQTDRVLATLMIPQLTADTGPTVYENVATGAGPVSILHPRGVALYKRGEITAEDEAAMVHAPVGYAPLPAGWRHDDIGAVGRTGSAYFGAGWFTVKAAGQGNAAADEAHQVYQTVAGDCAITARVTSQDASATAAAGVTIRAGLGDTAVSAQLVALPGGGLRFRHRAADGQPATEAALGAAGATPWLRLVRSGAVIAAYVSADGATWSGAGHIEAALGASLQFGLTASSGNDAVLHTATFDQASLMTPPRITAPDTITAEATGPTGATVNYTASATDVLGASVPVSASAPSGSLFPLGTTTVRLSATDLEGFTALKFLRVTVRDTTAPAILTATPSESELWPANHKMAPITIAVTATDAVDPAPAARIVAVSSSEPVDGNGDGNTEPDWEITGALSLRLRAERAGGGSGRTYTITVECTDAAGNRSTVDVIVRVPHSRSGR